ncbi:MAG: hypothetical protein IJT94_18505, partial [Oscillibacter sp.]|nr:hypothetical protein [Oscillibacter sp.]
GKSSIADAIAFAITGLPFFGERNIDRLSSERNPNLCIDLRFLDDAGQPHLLVRKRQKGRMDVTLDGRPIRQQDLNVLFGERDVFLSIFNPLYFIEELGDKGKELLERYLPDIPQEDVLAELGEAERSALHDKSLLQPDVFMKNLRAENKGFEERITYLTGQKDLAADQRKAAEGKAAELSAKLDRLRREREDLESRQFAGLDMGELQDQLLELNKRHQELTEEPAAVPDTAEIDGRLANLRQTQTNRGTTFYPQKHTQEIADADAQVNALLEEYKKAKRSLKGFKAGTICPMCRRAVTAKELPHVQAELRTLISSIVARGQAAKGKRDQLKEQEKQEEAAFYAEAEKEVDRLGRQIADLEKQRAAIVEAADRDNAANKAALEELVGQIQNLSATQECGTLTAEELARLEECRQEIAVCTAQLSAVRETLEEPPEDYEAQIQVVRQSIQANETLLNFAAAFAAKKAEMLFSSLRMNRAEISLFDVVKSTGLVKDVFKFTYGGRRYDRLSLSEKIRAGMEVS